MDSVRHNPLCAGSSLRCRRLSRWRQLGGRSPPPASGVSGTQRDGESSRVSECLDRLTTVAERQERLLSQSRAPDGFTVLEGVGSRKAEDDECYTDKVNALAGLVHAEAACYYGQR